MVWSILLNLKMVSNGEKNAKLVKLLINCLYEIDSINSNLSEVTNFRNLLINKSELILKKPLTLVLIGNSQGNKIKLLNAIIYYYSKGKYKNLFEEPYKDNIQSIKLIDNSDNPQFTVQVQQKIRTFNESQIEEIKEHLVFNETTNNNYFLEKIRIPFTYMPFRVLITPNLSINYFNEIPNVFGIFRAHLPFFILINDEKSSFEKDDKCRLALNAFNLFPTFLFILDHDQNEKNIEYYSSSILKDYPNIKIFGTHSFNFSKTDDNILNNFFFIEIFKNFENEFSSYLKIYHSVNVINRLLYYFKKEISNKYINTNDYIIIRDYKQKIRDDFYSDLDSFLSSLPNKTIIVKECKLYETLLKKLEKNENKLSTSSINRKEYMKAHINFIDEDIQYYFRDEVLQMTIKNVVSNETVNKKIQESNPFMFNQNLLNHFFKEIIEKRIKEINTLVFVKDIKIINIEYKFGTFIGLWTKPDVRLDIIRLIFLEINKEIFQIKEISIKLFEKLFGDFMSHLESLSKVFDLNSKINQILKDFTKDQPLTEHNCRYSIDNKFNY